MTEGQFGAPVENRAASIKQELEVLALVRKRKTASVANFRRQLEDRLAWLAQAEQREAQLREEYEGLVGNKREQA